MYIASGLARGKFQPGSGRQFAAQAVETLDIFRGDPFSVVWSAALQSSGRLGAADVDNDGIDELLLGESGLGTVDVYDLSGNEPRLRIPHAASGISAVAGVDLNGDGNRAIAFTPDWPTFGSDEVFRLVNGVTGESIWEWNNSEPGPYAPVVLGDLQGDGSRKLMYASEGTLYVSGSVSQLDAATGAAEWHSPPAAPGTIDVFSFKPKAMVVVRREDPAPIVVVAGDPSGGHLVAIDGRSHELLWHITRAGPLENRNVLDAVAFDFDGDGHDEIAVCTSKSADDDVRVAIFSGGNGEQRWQSPAMRAGIGSDRCRGVAAGRFDPVRNPVVVAMLPSSTQAFDAVTGSLAWTLPFIVSGMTLLDQGEHQREFATFGGTRLRFHDAATRAVLRQFDLSAPVLAVRQLAGDIRRVLVASGGRLLIVDGVSGEVLASSEFLGSGLGEGNHIATDDMGEGAWLIAAGSRVGVFRLVARVTDAMFGDGFDGH